MSWKDIFPRDNIYYETANGILYHGDSLGIMPTLPIESMNLLLTDPPYFVSKKKGTGFVLHNHVVRKHFGAWDQQWENDKEFYEWTSKWFSETIDLLEDKSWLVVFFGMFHLGLFPMVLAPKCSLYNKTIFTWCKTNPPPLPSHKIILPAVEQAWMGTKGKTALKVPDDFHAYIKNYYLQGNKGTYGKTRHTTEKPVKLFSMLIKITSYSGDIVFDPFIGSGTTAVSSEMTGRRWIGIENEKAHCDMVIKRLKTEV